VNVEERTIARKLFQLKIHKADGQTFEDLFTEIMNYTAPDFRPIKPWGNIGDRKNDGYIKTKGIFYQVFAPEKIETSYPNTIQKLETDFAGLKSQWSPIHEFYFVLNDKFKGVNADCEQALENIRIKYNLSKSDFLTAKDLENLTFKLSDDQILMITGQIPDPAKIKHLDYSTLNEVISYIMKLPLSQSTKPTTDLPDWSNKIEFNGLSESVTDLLNHGFYQVYSLEEYLTKNGDFLADSLRDKMNQIYLNKKSNINGDDLFWAIVAEASPRTEQMSQTAVIVIMSKYFESCDIFKEPFKEVSC
jgi:C-terminal domain 10 of the ABC-three component (ABC-3C) systems